MDEQTSKHLQSSALKIRNFLFSSSIAAFPSQCRQFMLVSQHYRHLGVLVAEFKPITKPTKTIAYNHYFYDTEAFIHRYGALLNDENHRWVYTYDAVNHFLVAVVHRFGPVAVVSMVSVALFVDMTGTPLLNPAMRRVTEINSDESTEFAQRRDQVAKLVNALQNATGLEEAALRECDEFEPIARYVAQGGYCGGQIKGMVYCFACIQSI